MSTKDDVIERLRMQAAQRPDERAKAERFRQKMGELLDRMQAWLRPLEDEKVLSTFRTQWGSAEGDEGLTGAERLRVRASGGMWFDVTPVAYTTAKGYGRVDVHGIGPEYHLLLDDEGEWQIAELSRDGEWIVGPFDEDRFWKIIGRLLAR